jgi:hypothetical protein
MVKFRSAATPLLGNLNPAAAAPAASSLASETPLANSASTRAPQNSSESRSN